MAKYLRINGDNDAPYSEDILVVDTVSGYYETLLKLKVKPNFIVFDEWMVEVLSDYMEDV